MTEFPERSTNIRPSRLRIPQSMADLSRGPGRWILWVRGCAVAAARRQGYPAVLLHPVQDDLGVRPLDVGVLERMPDETVQVPPVPEPDDQERVEIPGDIVDSVRPGVEAQPLI